jgi:hypothetical protein
MKLGIEEKRELAEKDILVNENSIKAQNIEIYYKKNRISSIFIDGKFDYETIKKLIVKYPDSDWVNLVIDNQIHRSDFTFSGNHQKIHEKIKELIQKLNIVTYLNITERNSIGYTSIETVSHKYHQNDSERITIKYVIDTIEKVELSYISRKETKKAVMEVLNIPNLDKISAGIIDLSLEGQIAKGIDQKLVEFINTLNQPVSLYCNTKRCEYLPNLPNKFLYFDNKIYPLVIDMKEMYPQVANFLPEEIRKVLDRFSGYDTTIFFVANTKKEYEKVLSKALTVLSKLNPPVPEYLSFSEETFQTKKIIIRGSYEKLDVNLNLLFQPEGTILLPLSMVIYGDKHKVLSICEPAQTNERTKKLITTLKNFLGTEAIIEYSEELQKQKNNNILYYLLTDGNYYIITTKELLPTVIRSLKKFAM